MTVKYPLEQHLNKPIQTNKISKKIKTDNNDTCKTEPKNIQQPV